MPVLPATRPNLPSAVASEDKEKRHRCYEVAIFFGFLGHIAAKNDVGKRRPHKAQKGRRWKNRQPPQSAPKIT
jgi:hypothetical protein